MKNTNLRHAVLVAMLVTSHYLWSTRGVVVAMPEQCDEICVSTSEPCDTSCGIGYTMMDCGTYLRNGFEGQCNVPYWEDCNYLCSSSGSPSTSCLEFGVSSNCGNYGLYASCGDGICADGETCDGCSGDCGSCPATPNYMDAYSMMEDMETAGGLTGSAGSAEIDLEVAVTHGFADSWEAPDFDESWEQEPNLPCEWKKALLEILNIQITTLKRQQKVLLYGSIAAAAALQSGLSLTLAGAAIAIQDDIDAKEQDRSRLQAERCWAPLPD